LAFNFQYRCKYEKTVTNRVLIVTARRNSGKPFGGDAGIDHSAKVSVMRPAAQISGSE
jgi:hypothetical protein